MQTLISEKQLLSILEFEKTARSLFLPWKRHLTVEIIGEVVNGKFFLEFSSWMDEEYQHLNLVPPIHIPRQRVEISHGLIATLKYHTQVLEKILGNPPSEKYWENALEKYDNN